ncbi:MAG TPA: GxxExxY protein, partial [Vicinamibacterales bacterium]|nr:GxxExxY protein [Vicinamibacterales bacterium]
QRPRRFFLQARHRDSHERPRWGAPPLAGSGAVSEAGRLNTITDAIIGAAIRVHDEVGPGMLEAAYEAFLAFELSDRGLDVRRQVPLPLTYRGHVLELGYRIDLLVEGAVIVEVKSIERFDTVHFAQLRSYLRQHGSKVGLLLNFNVKVLSRDGLRRFVNDFPDK